MGAATLPKRPEQAIRSFISSDDSGKGIERRLGWKYATATKRLVGALGNTGRGLLVDQRAWSSGEQQPNNRLGLLQQVAVSIELF